MLRGLCRFMVRRAGRLADDHANAVYVDRLRRELVMDVFDLDEAVIDRYKAFARSFTDIRSPELSAKVDELYATRHFRPEPLIQLNLHYADGGSIQDSSTQAIWNRNASRCFGACRILRRDGMLTVNDYQPFRRIWRQSPPSMFNIDQHPSVSPRTIPPNSCKLCG